MNKVDAAIAAAKKDGLTLAITYAKSESTSLVAFRAAVKELIGRDLAEDATSFTPMLMNGDHEDWDSLICSEMGKMVKKIAVTVITRDGRFIVVTQTRADRDNQLLYKYGATGALLYGDDVPHDWVTELVKNYIHVTQ